MKALCTCRNFPLRRRWAVAPGRAVAAAAGYETERQRESKMKWTKVFEPSAGGDVRGF